MELKIVSEGTAEEVSDLLIWLKHERITGMRFEQEREEIAPGVMGSNFLAIITAFMATTISLPLAFETLQEFINSVQRWIESTESKINLTVKFSDGTEIDLKGKFDVQKALEQILLKK